MATINLLPWREQRRERHKRQFVSLLAGALVLGLVFLFVADQYLTLELDRQTARNDLLQREVNRLDRQIREISDLKKRRQQLLERSKIIHDLQGDRATIAHVFDQMIRTLPEGVFFTEMRMAGPRISIIGFADSNSRVSNLMRNLDASEWLSNPNLTGVRAAVAKDSEQRNRFQMDVQQTRPPEAAPAPEPKEAPKP